MNKNFLNILILLISVSMVSAGTVPCLDGDGPLLIGQEYCSDEYSGLFNFFATEHYELNYLSTFTHYFYIEQLENTPLLVKVNWGFDLNNPAPSMTADKYRIVEEYDFNNFVRPSSSDDIINNYDDYRVSANPDLLDVYSTDFVSMPISIVRCYLNCDVRGDSAGPMITDLDDIGGDIWYQYLYDTSNPNNNDEQVSQDWLDDRYGKDGQFRDIYKTYRFEDQFSQCAYETGGEKEIQMGCTFKLDNYLRYPNIDDYEINFRDFLSFFPEASDGKEYWTYQKTIILDLDNDNYSISSVTTPAPDGDGYIPPTGEGILEQYDSMPDVEEQKSVYLLKERIDLENAWQTSLINIAGIFFSLFMIVFYTMSLFVMLFLYFGSLPFIFRKVTDNLNALVSLKIKKRYK